MPKSLIKPREDAVPNSAPPTAPEPQMETAPPAASAHADVSTMLALYKKCVEGGYQNCDVLMQMAAGAIKERLRSAIEAELASIISPELRTQIGQICVEV